MSFDGTTTDGGGEFDDDELIENDDENLPEEELKDLTGVMGALHVFPLQLLPQSRKEETAAQPLLVRPAAPPIVSKLSDPASLIRKSYSKTAEMNIMRGLSVELVEANDQSQAGEVEALLLRENERLEKGKGSASTYVPSPGYSAPSSSSSSATPFVPTFHATTHLFGGAHTYDGLFSGPGPLLTNILLAGEEPSAEIASMLANSVDLSRVTQRTLRELQSALKGEQVRKLFAEKSKRPLLDRGNHSLAPVHLLRQVNHTPVLRVIESPTIATAALPVIPSPSTQYGGSWGIGATLLRPRRG